MSKIGYGYGSEWHLLRYLGRHRTALDHALLSHLSGQSIEWLDFPFAPYNEPLYDDHEWLRLDFIPDADVQQQWVTFWPSTGQPYNWDAVAKLRQGHQDEWLLVEAKAHVGELDSVCSAGEVSRARIRSALERTQRSFQVQNTSPDIWLTSYYQYANRLAALHFLMHECVPAIPAHLVFIYFLGDARKGKICPKNVEEWHEPLHKVHTTLGLTSSNTLLQHVHHIFLPVSPIAQGVRKVAP